MPELVAIRALQVERAVEQSLLHRGVDAALVLTVERDDLARPRRQRVRSVRAEDGEPGRGDGTAGAEEPHKTGSGKRARDPAGAPTVSPRGWPRGRPRA